MNEKPVLMGADGTLFGICTEGKFASGLGVIILNSGLLHHVGPYGLHVKLARALVELGCSTIRLDQSGKGESPLRKGLSSNEALLKDFDDTVGELGKRGVVSVILVGLCSGADDALFIAQHRSNICGLVLLDGYAMRTTRHYFNHYSSRAFKLGPWLRAFRRMLKAILAQNQASEAESVLDIRNWPEDDEMKARFAKILENETNILAIFSGGVEDYYNYHGQLADSLGLSRESSALAEIYYPGADHTYSVAAHRTKLIEDVGRWVKGQIKQHEAPVRKG